MTQNIRAKAPLPFSPFALNRAADVLCAYLLCCGLLFWLLPLAGVPVAPWSCLLAAGLAGILGVLLSLRWWVGPAAAGLAALAGGGFLLALWFTGGESPARLLRWGLDWLADLPLLLTEEGAQGSLSPGQAAFLLQCLLALPLFGLCMAFFRRCFSFCALGLLCGGEIAFLWIGGYDTLLWALGCLLAVLIVSLPRLYFRELDTAPAQEAPANTPEFLRDDSRRGRRRERENAAPIPRYTLQLLAVPAAVLCVLGSFIMVPEDTVPWRSATIRNLIADVNDYLGFSSGQGYPGLGFDIGASGFLPLGDRLGGPIRPDNVTVLSVTSTAPVFLRGSTQNFYTGQGWADSGSLGHFRWESFLWRGRRKELFAPSLPLGGKEARKLAEGMTTQATVTVSHRNNRHASLFSLLRVRRLRLDTRTGNETYFNLQGELFWDKALPYSTAYTLEGSFYDRTLPGFDEAMLALEPIAAGEEDSAWEGICRDYLQLPDTLPESVYALTAEITAGFHSPYEKAAALEAWLAGHCSYSLSPAVPAEGEDFTAAFLRDREGYCTYYATAMAVMARCAGLPSRYVTGYGLIPTGRAEPNYTATNATAHAWCEIYFSGIGWVAFDPVSWTEAREAQAALTATPQAPSPSQDATARLPEPQPEPQLPEAGLETFPEVEPNRKPGVNLLGIAGVFLGVLAVLLGAFALYPYLCDRPFRLYERRYVQRRYPNRGEAAEYYYRDILRQLAFFDREPRPGDTIRTFAARVDQRIPAGNVSMGEIGGILEALRFGGIAPDWGQLEQMERYHNRLEDMLREKLPRGRYFLLRVLPGFWGR